MEVPQNIVEMMKEIKKHGYAVAVFTPSEMNGADPHDVECAMIEGGWGWISNNTEED